MKKKSVKVIILSIAALMLSACGASSTSAVGSDDTPLTVWNVQTDETIKPVLDQAVERFNADHPGFYAVNEPIMNDAYKDKLKIAMSSNSMPDLYIHWTGDPMISYIKAGKVLDLTDYMNQDNYKDRFLDGAIAQATYDNKIWCVPAENVAVAVIFYNKKIFEEHNIPVPQTISELEGVCDQLKSFGISPFALANKTKWTGSIYYMYLVDRIGGSDVFTNAANQTNGSFENDAFTRTGEILQQWVDKEYFIPGFNGLDEDAAQARTTFYAGDSAMYLMGSWAVNTMLSENPDFVENIDVFPFPVMDNGKGDPTAIIGTVGDNFFSINPNTPDPDAAFQLTQYLTDDTTMRQRVEQGKIAPIKGVTVENPLLQKILDIIENASSVQLWYDQYLPPELSELHKDTTQALFAKEKTPQEINAEMEELATELLKE